MLTELYIQQSKWMYKNIKICEVSCVSHNEHFCLSEFMDLCVYAVYLFRCFSCCFIKI